MSVRRSSGLPFARQSWRGPSQGGMAVVGCLSLLTLVFAQPTEPIREVWQRPSRGIQFLAISPDGDRTAVVTWDGEVLCWADGRQSWRHVVPGAEAVALGTGGRAVIYTPRDAMRRDLLLLDSKGQISGRATAGGPITALAISPTGRTVAVGTAGSSVEIHPLDRRTALQRLTLPGACQQICYDSQGSLVITTVRPAWLLQFDSEGRLMWREAAPAKCEFRLGTPPRAVGRSPQAGLTVAAVVPSGASRPGSTGKAPRDGGDSLNRRQFRLLAYSSSGKPVWQSTLSGRSPNMRTMEGSGDTVVAYERAERRGASLRYNRVLACFNRFGSQEWAQGGMVYNPLLVAVSPEGDTVLSLCSGNRFVLLSGGGQNLWSYTARAPVRMVRASRDGTTAVLVTTDDQLSLLKISAPVGGKRPEPEVARQSRDDLR